MYKKILFLLIIIHLSFSQLIGRISLHLGEHTGFSLERGNVLLYQIKLAHYNLLGIQKTKIMDSWKITNYYGIDISAMLKERIKVTNNYEWEFGQGIISRSIKRNQQYSNYSSSEIIVTRLALALSARQNIKIKDNTILFLEATFTTFSDYMNYGILTYPTSEYILNLGISFIIKVEEK